MEPRFEKIFNGLIKEYDELFRTWQVRIYHAAMHPNEPYSEIDVFIDMLVEERRKEWAKCLSANA